MYRPPKIERFNQEVLSKYNVFNSIFLTLPFDEIYDTGSLLPLFGKACEEGFAQGLSPKEIIEAFTEKYLDRGNERERIDLMFRFIQYIERQVVLFDAVEDAAFPVVNDLEGKGSLRDVKDRFEANGERKALVAFLEDFQVRPVLTAHPTQFYPGAVLGIITDLTAAIRENDLARIKELLSQLGKTPFIKKAKPTPYDEAVSLVWYLENVFYDTAGEMTQFIRKNILKSSEGANVIRLGFWPGGDRDGNPFVTTQITLQVADRLRGALLRKYYADIRGLKRKLTFPGVESLVAGIEAKIYRAAYYAEEGLTTGFLKSALAEIRQIVVAEHQSLYLDEIDTFAGKVALFGQHFASLDIRQNSRIHDAVYQEFAKLGWLDGYEGKSAPEKIKMLAKVGRANWEALQDGIARQTLESVAAMREIQKRNGERGSNRYIISNCESALQVVETLALFGLAGWQNPPADIVPLFESVDDLKMAGSIMAELYGDPGYAAHLESRGRKQTVMLGFSDGTKDGGYLMANWGIYRAKETITEVSRKHRVDVIFFDGRGGPPARGGGKTHKFYASLGPGIENREIQVTVQGQTISSNFGTRDSCRYNLETLLSAGIGNHFNAESHALSAAQRRIMDELSKTGLDTYSAFKQHPKFLPYLERVSTLRYYSKTNIGSRPSKREPSKALDFGDLRAIPFVASWSHLKQNVPGFFGVGTALEAFDKTGRWQEVKDFYDASLFFRTLLENSMMSLAKSFLPLTAYMEDDPEFGAFWQIIRDEFELTRTMLLKVAGHDELMENYPDGKASVEMREKIVRPLLVVQQYALLRIENLSTSDPELTAIYEKLVTRSLFGNTNASRNSA
jgi:phosphoenolpyruvate carboxylase